MDGARLAAALALLAAAYAASLDTVEEEGCVEDGECVEGGICRKPAESEVGQCLCFRSCSRGVPLECSKNYHCISSNNMCNKAMDMCVCPSGPYEKCYKSSLAIVQLSATKDTPYRGEKTDLVCCINVDPRGHVGDVHWLQNNTIRRAATETPYDRGLGSDDKNSWYERCWYLNLTSVSERDSGRWSCVVPSTASNTLVKKTIPIIVREPIRVSVSAEAVSPTALKISWDTGSIRLIVNLHVEASSGQDADLEHEEQDFSGLSNNSIVVDGLLPATWYTATVSTVKTKDNATVVNKAYARTLPDLSELVQLVEIRIQDRLSRRKCEISWRPPREDNGKIHYYEVSLEGRIRAESGSLTGVHRPSSTNCGTPAGQKRRIRVSPSRFMICEFHGLLPNRNYSAKVWVVNEAGTSEAAEFESQCRTDFGGPEKVGGLSASEFNDTIALEFPPPPDQTNGPIVCFYVAMMPLLDEVDVAKLSAPKEVPIDSLEGAVNANLNLVDEEGYDDNGILLAYIAESYPILPTNTVIGDEVERRECPVLYRSRYKAEDRALRVGIRYTGFLIARVDPDESLYSDGEGRRKRHLSSWLQPRYAYSAYFQPVRVGGEGIEEALRDAGSWLGLTIALSLLLLLLLAATAGLVYFIRNDPHFKSRLFPACLSGSVESVDAVVQAPPQPARVETVQQKRSFGAIPAGSLVGEYQVRHRDSDFLFSAEFDALPHHSAPAAASRHPDNAWKNRYNDIVAFDATRVKLRASPAEPLSDYVNANFIDGYKGERKYIAAQGPLPKTVCDFWRMIWEHHVQIVVMVTNLQEKYRAQCTKYWPEGENMIYGDIEVHPAEVETNADFTVRSFELIGPAVRPSSSHSQWPEEEEPLYDTVAVEGLERQGSQRSGRNSAFDRSDSGRFERASSSRSSENSKARSSKRSRHSSTSLSSPCQSRLADGGASSPLLGLRENPVLHTTRTLYQWHYTDFEGLSSFSTKLMMVGGWNDYKAPENTMGLLQFLLRLRALPLFSAPFPILVHCSAGVGRTGTFVAIDGLLSQLAEEGKADVFGLVSSMRAQRNFMVQSLEQYVFVYRALAEWLSFGDTDLPADRFPTVLAALRQAGRLREEFQKLERTLERAGGVEFGRRAGNAGRNREGAAVPFDRNRVVLQPVVGHVDASYVNASLIRGSSQPLIISQDPLSGTRWDFWRMVNEQSVAHILCLSHGQAGFGSLPDERYWPESVNERMSFGEVAPRVLVSLVREDRLSPHIIRRRLSYALSKDGQTVGERREVVAWVLVGWWAEGRPVPESTGPLLDCLCQDRNPGPLLLHCRDGATRCGVVAALVILLERLRLERRVDVFQTVKSIQYQRSPSLQQFAQYDFVYQAVLDYLQSNPPE